MTSAAVDTGWGFESMVQAWEETDAPAGWRTEITEKGITVTPPPSPSHNLIADLIDKLLRASLPSELALAQSLGLMVSEAGRLYVPDIVVLPREALRTDDSTVSARLAMLVIEITSKDNADDDRTSKKAAYARGGVPLYLLVDRFDADGPAVTLFSKPAGFHYRDSTQVPFGEPITVPDPFGIALDTSAFPKP